MSVALVKLEAPRLSRVLSDTTIAVQLFPLTSSSHVTHYYVAVVPANLRVASNDVRLDEVRHLASFVTFRVVSRRRREMYCGHARMCVCLSVGLSAAACLHYCTDPDVTWGSGRGCPLVVQYWADLQSVHGLRCYGNSRNAWQSPAVIHQAHRTPHALCMPATTPLASDKIDAPVACATLSATKPLHFVHTARGCCNANAKC